MNVNGRFWKSVGLLGASAFAAVVLQAGTTTTATVESILAGKAQFSQNGKTWSTLQVGTALTQGATLKTDSHASVDLFLGSNGTLLRLAPNSILTLTVLSTTEGIGDTKTVVDLKKGTLVGVVGRMSASSQFVVKTSKGTYQQVAGTKFAGSANGQVVVIDGAANLQYADNTTAVKAGSTFEPTANRVINTPADLAAAVNLQVNQLEQLSGTLSGKLASNWAPTPTWLIIPRPFGGINFVFGGTPSFNLPPVVRDRGGIVPPTTPVSP